MKLYKLPATNFESLFGNPMERKQVDVVIIAQKPNCLSFFGIIKNKLFIT